MRLPARLRAALYAAAVVVAGTGIVWLFVHDRWRRLGVACMEVHGSVAMALLVLIGAAAALHAPSGWRERKNRTSGALLASALTLLVITSALLYYLGDDRARGIASTVHWTVGLIMLAVAAVHVSLAGRNR